MSIDDLPERAAMALRRLARGWSAASPLAKLPKTLGLEAEEAAEALAELQDLGLVEIWEHGPGDAPCVVLTALAASQLNVELEDDSRTGFRLRWCTIGTGDDPGPERDELERLEAEILGDGESFDYMGELADPKAVDPLDALIQAEAAALFEARMARRAARGEFVEGPRPEPRLPRPAMLLGLSVPWPATVQAGEPCPGCVGREHGGTWACLLCHAYSHQRLIVEPPKRLRKTHASKPEAVADGVEVAAPDAEERPGLAGGTGKAVGGRVKEPRTSRRKPGKKTEAFDLRALRARLEAG